MKNIGAAGLQGEGPQGRPPQAAVAGRPQAAPQPRRSRGCGPYAAACRGVRGSRIRPLLGAERPAGNEGIGV